MDVPLRIASVVNAGLWFGAGAFLTAVVGPNFFSPAVTDLVGRQNAGLIAQSVLAKYFVLQLACAALAAALLFAQVRSLRCRHLVVLLGLLGVVALGGAWIQPKLVGLNRQRYASTSQEEKERLGKEFGKWHGVSQAGNLLVLVGSLVHLAVLARGPRRTTPIAS
jgi:MFS family permease